MVGECVPANFCPATGVKAGRVDNKNNLINWIVDFDLLCVGQQSILAFYMLLFVGMAIGGLVLAPLSDKYGRKKVFVAALIAIGTFYILMLMSKSQREL